MQNTTDMEVTVFIEAACYMYILYVVLLSAKVNRPHVYYLLKWDFYALVHQRSTTIQLFNSAGVSARQVLPFCPVKDTATHVNNRSA